jgi:hypothetical protein
LFIGLTGDSESDGFDQARSSLYLNDNELVVVLRGGSRVELHSFDKVKVIIPSKLAGQAGSKYT